MIFAAPIWLLMLLPLALLALWLMRRERTSSRVPFLPLWQKTAIAPKTSELFHPPPLAIVAVLAALMLAIIASARPMLRSAGNDRSVAVIVDRGIPTARRDDMVRQANQAIRQLGAARVTVVNVQGQRVHADASQWPSAISPASADESGPSLRSAVADELREDGKPVLVLSDRSIDVIDPRVVLIAPSRPLENVAIVRFALRDRPTTQAMVTLRNDSPGGRAVLKIESAAKVATREIGLPTRGTEQTYFVDLQAAGETGRASVEIADDIELDNIATLVRRHDRPRVEARGSVPAEVARVVEAYRRARPPSGAGSIVVVTADPGALASGEEGVIVGPVATGPLDPAHPIAAGIDWSRVADKPLVTARDTPVRRVEVSEPSELFARTPEFVMLWTNILDWLGGGGAVAQFEPAATAPAMHVPAAPPPDWRDRINALSRRDPPGLNLLPYLAIGSLACLLLAALAWPGRSLTHLWAPRTV